MVASGAPEDESAQKPVLLDGNGLLALRTDEPGSLRRLHGAS